MTGWQPIETAPAVEWGKSVEALVYSPQLGIKSATIGSNNGYIFASVSSYHGNAVESWGVTHWMPLPAPPETAA